MCGEQLKTAGFEVVRVAGAQRHINTLNMIQFTTSDGQRVAIIPKSDTSEQKSPSHDVREALEERGVIVEEVSFDVGFCILCAGGGLSCASKAIV